MSERIKIVKSFYGNIDEDTRLNRSRHGQMEYLTTMEYIHRYVTDGAKILEIGAGTGRYSIALAKEGYDVTAVELVEHNLDILKANGGLVEGIEENFTDEYKVKHLQNTIWQLVKKENCLVVQVICSIFVEEDKFEIYGGKKKW